MHRTLFRRHAALRWLLLGCCTLVLLAASAPFGASQVRPEPTENFQVDASILDKFTGPKRNLLLRYLSSDAIWEVSTPGNDQKIAFQYGKWEHACIARLRVTDSFYRNGDRFSPDTCFADFKRTGWFRSGTLDKNVNVLIAIRGDSDPDEGIKAAVGTKRVFPMKRSDYPTGSGHYMSSELEIPSRDVAITISEASYSKERTGTKATLSFVLDQLKRISAAMDKQNSFDESVLTPGSVKHVNSDEITLSDKLLSGYINPGKEGVLKLHAYSTGMTFLRSLGDRCNTTGLCGWSNNPNERFYFAMPYAVNTGDGDGPRYSEFKYELRFVPKDGSAERLLFTH